MVLIVNTSGRSDLAFPLWNSNQAKTGISQRRSDEEEEGGPRGYRGKEKIKQENKVDTEVQQTEWTEVRGSEVGEDRGRGTSR